MSSSPVHVSTILADLPRKPLSDRAAAYDELMERDEPIGDFTNPAPSNLDDREGCDHVPLRFEGLFLESFDATVGPAAAAALAAIRRLVAGEVRSVLLSGPVGCGKTHLAAIACSEQGGPLNDALREAEWAKSATTSDPLQAISRTSAFSAWERAKQAARRGCPIWVSVPALLGQLRREMGGADHGTAALIDAAIKARGILVLDDLGSEKASEWTASTLFEIVSARYDSEAPMLVTSNLTAQQLDSIGYERIVSRLRDQGTLVEMASASDYRKRLRRALP